MKLDIINTSDEGQEKGFIKMEQEIEELNKKMNESYINNLPEFLDEENLSFENKMNIFDVYEECLKSLRNFIEFVFSNINYKFPDKFKNISENNKIFFIYSFLNFSINQYLIIHSVNIDYNENINNFMKKEEAFIYCHTLISIIKTSMQNFNNFISFMNNIHNILQLEVDIFFFQLFIIKEDISSRKSLVYDLLISILSQETFRINFSEYFNYEILFMSGQSKISDKIRFIKKLFRIILKNEKFMIRDLKKEFEIKDHILNIILLSDDDKINKIPNEIQVEVNLFFNKIYEIFN